MSVDEIVVVGVVGDRIRWLLTRIEAHSPDADVRDTAEALKSDDPKGFFQWLSSQIAGFQVLTVTPDPGSPLVASVRVSCPNGRTWDLAIRLEEEAPHRIEWVQLDRALLDGMEIRAAESGDADGIREVCRNSEIVLRNETVRIDPGPDYFAAIRMMEHSTVLVATHHGRVVGVHCGAFYPIRYGGQPQWMSQILHSRVLSDYAGLGLWSVMNRRLVNAANERRQEAASAGDPVFQNGCAYFAAENDAARRLNGAQAAWTFQPYRAVIECSAIAASADQSGSRRATDADASRIVEIVNACHDGEELFAPYTVDSLAARLERAPDVYSWHNVLLSDRALIGSWHAARSHIKRPREAGDDAPESVSVRTLVLDYGFLPGAEHEFESLLGLVARQALDAGMTHLSIFTSDASPGSVLLRRLACDIERYELATPYTPEPDGAASRGLYVDQIYF